MFPLKHSYHWGNKIVLPSPEGLLGQLDDVGGGLNIDVVIVEGGWIGGGAGLSQ